MSPEKVVIMAAQQSHSKKIVLSAEQEERLSQRLRSAQLRLTRQRVLLAYLLFRDGNRHVTADGLYEEARMVGLSISQATIYNTLNQFLEAGLLREVIVDSHRSYFDTNLGDHHHFYVEETGQLIDVPHDAIQLAQIPSAPSGFDVAGVDVVLRLAVAK